MIVVFDLDDTLYCEASFRSSACKHICKVVSKLYDVPEHEIINVISSCKGDWIDRVCRYIDVPDARESLLWMYRLHEPEIFLDPACVRLIDQLKADGHKVITLTDGRSLTQRMKLNALGLLEYPTFISQEYGNSDKPSLNRFKEIMRQFPSTEYVYIGDNPVKDFIAPNQLGWKTIGLKFKKGFINNYDLDTIPTAHHPQMWICGLKNLLEIL